MHTPHMTSPSVSFTLATPLVLSRPRARPHRHHVPHSSLSLDPHPPSPPSRIARLRAYLAHLETFTRPGSVAGAEGRMRNRYEALPTAVKTDNQMLGRMSPGCEGTHGVFPKCNFRCSPCYHSADANSVRTDGAHTVTEVARQMAFLAKERGPVAHCQLIGGEVSLLPAEDHARALEIMRFYGRLPMSFTHGDFDYAYLKALAVHPDGTRRFDRLDFAAHFDRFMYGRRGARAPKSEMHLHRHRRRFVAMFARLQRRHGVRCYLAHNMTVQPGNISEIADVVTEVLPYGFRMLSFQPAAAQGAMARRVAPLRAIDNEKSDDDLLWTEIEKGAGTRLPFTLFQMGHPRCNRVCLCAVIGAHHVVPLFDDRDSADERFRDLLMSRFGNIVLPPGVLWLKTIRVLARRPWLLFAIFAWMARFVRRAGGPWRIVRHRFRLITFVMHRFMDADDVTKAWSLMENGCNEQSKEVQEAGLRVQETVERLMSCSYGMAQVGQGRVVPACVQHSVYDEDENRRLAKELKLREDDQQPLEGEARRQVVGELQ